MPDVEVVAGAPRPGVRRRGATARPPRDFERGNDESGFAPRPLIRRTLIGALVLLPIPPSCCCSRPRARCPRRTKSPRTSCRHDLDRRARASSRDGTVRSRSGPRTCPSAASSPRVPEDLPRGRGGRGQPQRPRQGGDHPRPDGPRRDPRPAGRRLGLPGHPRLLEDLHPRRLPHRPVRAAHPPPAVPVPPVDLRPGRRAATSSSARPRGALPQLPIAVDEEGYLVATSDFAEPVGPSFWERG